MTLTMADTIEYYNQNAQGFFNETKDLDMSEFYNRFESHLPETGHILDLGCGSGRDAIHFHSKGYQVTGIDASVALIKLASMNSPLEVSYHVMSFDQIEWRNEFDGIWACASLLHCKQAELEPTLLRIYKALKPGATFYCSFKEGSGERQKGERQFLDIHLDDLTALLQGLHFEILDSWVTKDVREGREHEFWTNCLAKK